MRGFSIILILKGVMTFEGQIVHAFCWTKNINFNKKETESKMEKSTHIFGWRTLYFSSYKNRKLKVKLWWDRACERKNRAIFVPFILSEENFVKICILSQCIVYWTHFQNIHTFTYQKTLLKHFCYLILKSLKAFSVFLSITFFADCVMC